MGADRERVGDMRLWVRVSIGLMAYLRLRTDVAAGSMKASSVAPVTLMPDARRSNSSIASSSRSRSTGTPCTLPDAAQATAASSSSCVAADPRPGCS